MVAGLVLIRSAVLWVPLMVLAAELTDYDSLPSDAAVAIDPEDGKGEGAAGAGAVQLLRQQLLSAELQPKLYVLGRVPLSKGLLVGGLLLATGSTLAALAAGVSL